MFHVSLGHTAWWALVCVAVSGVAAWAMYHRSAGVQQWLRWLLAGMRFISFTVLLFLLLEPVLTSLFAERSAPIVAVLHDNSTSMIASKDSAYVRRQLMPDVNNQLAGLAPSTRIDHWRFAGAAKPDTGNKPIAYNGNESNPAAALQTLQAHYRDQNLAAVVLLTDGIVTEGGNPQFAVNDLQVPVFPVLVGDTLQHQDVFIEQVIHNDLTYLNMETPLQVQLRAFGYDNQMAEVTLSHNRKVLEKRSVTLAANRPITVPFTVKADAVDLQRYDVSVSPLPRETNLRNNQRSVFIQVLENRINVMIVAGAPHPDVRALQAAFAADKRYNCNVYVRKDALNWYEAPTAEAVQKTDFVVLHNFPAQPTDRLLAEQLAREAAARKLPMWHIVGLLGMPELAPALQTNMALTARRREADADEATLQLNESYKAHASYPFAADDAFYDWLATAPPLLRNTSDWQPQPGAVVYGRANIKDIALDYPMFAVQETDGAKSIVLVAENLWRLRLHAYREKQSFAYFDDWVHGLAQWAVVRQDKRPFKVQPMRQVFAGGDAVIIRGQAYDAANKPLQDVSIKLQLTDSSGKVQDLFLKEVQPGAYSLELTNLEPGAYRYKAEGTRTVAGRTEVVGQDQGRFWVGASSLEYTRLQADAPLLRQMALATGGRFFTMATLPQLAVALRQNPLLKPLVSYRESSLALNKLWWPLALLLVLLGAEWVLRKRNGLP